LSPGPPLGLNADRYRWLGDAFYELPPPLARGGRVAVAIA
jgi:hypothetical protein